VKPTLKPFQDEKGRLYWETSKKEVEKPEWNLVEGHHLADLLFNKAPKLFTKTSMLTQCDTKCVNKLQVTTRPLPFPVVKVAIQAVCPDPCVYCGFFFMQQMLQLLPHTKTRVVTTLKNSVAKTSSMQHTAILCKDQSQRLPAH
jgi:hypothetical protein